MSVISWMTDSFRALNTSPPNRYLKTRCWEIWSDKGWSGGGRWKRRSSAKTKSSSGDGLAALLKLLNLFMDVFELSSSHRLCRFCCTFLSVSSKSCCSKSSTFIDSCWVIFFIYLFLQAIFPLFPDGHLRAAFLPDQHTSGCSLPEPRLCCPAGSPQLSPFTDLDMLRHPSSFSAWTSELFHSAQQLQTESRLSE